MRTLISKDNKIGSSKSCISLWPTPMYLGSKNTRSKRPRCMHSSGAGAVQHCRARYAAWRTLSQTSKNSRSSWSKQLSNYPSIIPLRYSHTSPPPMPITTFSPYGRRMKRAWPTTTIGSSLQGTLWSTNWVHCPSFVWRKESRVIPQVDLEFQPTQVILVQIHLYHQYHQSRRFQATSGSIPRHLMTSIWRSYFWKVRTTSNMDH